MKVDRLVNAPFTLDDSKSKFKFSSSTLTTFWYTIDGVERNPQPLNEPTLIVTHFTTEEETPESVADRYMDQLLDEDFSEAEINSVSSAPTNGYPSYKVEISAKLKGEPVSLFQHVVQSGTTYIIMLGRTNGSDKESMEEFKRLTRTIKAR